MVAAELLPPPQSKALEPVLWGPILHTTASIASYVLSSTIAKASCKSYGRFFVCFLHAVPDARKVFLSICMGCIENVIY